MIIREDGDYLLLVRQADHALLSGSLAAAWGRADLGRGGEPGGAGAGPLRAGAWWMTDVACEVGSNRFSREALDEARAVNGAVKPAGVPEIVWAIKSAEAPSAAEPRRRHQCAGVHVRCFDIGTHSTHVPPAWRPARGAAIVRS